MKIEKILNNNVVITNDASGRETIVMGKGIAYKRKVGEYVSSESIDKKYILSNQADSVRLQEILLEVPVEYVELGNKIVDLAKSRLNNQFTDNIYINIIDHIYATVQRFSDGVELKNIFIWDIKRFFKPEYEVGMEALQLINKTFEVELPQDEAGFIALHLLNNGFDSSFNESEKITKIMQEITTLIKYFFKVEFDEESVMYHRFITHLKFFAYRLVSNTHYQEDSDTDLILMIRHKYKNAYDCVDKISEFIEQQYQYRITPDEQLYLTIHIDRVVNNKLIKEDSAN